ncbi:nuclear transport factor 2 family protein [Sediminicola luteus]|uniref:DUF4440 domain-containing protein n=1 Tax=Sediminicola luteus TaxID=319238 RepID=A0A2A4GC45_9FLAO|nr:nuclear transport factor 2 family protein [Sediminicola luteus]PCE66023.1 DUF4440 domain-containing protein [Sediminicola luteus]
MENQEKIALLKTFAEAFNKHDIETLMACMTPDCIYEGSAGTHAHGTRFSGAKEVRQSFLDIFKAFPDAQWNDDTHFVSGDRGCSMWYFTGTYANGKQVEVNGCDLFTFRDGKIHIKDSYRKNRTK